MTALPGGRILGGMAPGAGVWFRPPNHGPAHNPRVSIDRPWRPDPDSLDRKGQHPCPIPSG
ncbi:hypothetical protein MTBLM5_530002 [Magnetospirillum sp. LM-5]|nr:hypothetical protein MTBLM5_530002 [Magnetospirillum sp. LM-5]